MGAAAESALTTDEHRRVQRVLDDVHEAASVADLLSRTLEALDEHVGVRDSAFMLALAGENRPYAGSKHGSPPYVFEEYMERWAGLDALGSPQALVLYGVRGWATTTEVYPYLDRARRRYVDDFLRRVHEDHQLSFRLAAAGTEAYLTTADQQLPSRSTRRMLAALVDPITEELRQRLPRGLDGLLSGREAQVAELVALGFSNREIAGILGIQDRTVDKHLEHAYLRLGMQRRTELAVAWATGRRLDVRHLGTTRG